MENNSGIDQPIKPSEETRTNRTSVQLNPEELLKVDPSKRESLQAQLNKLDASNQGHQSLAVALTVIYQDYPTIDAKRSKSTNVRYQPACANVNTVTPTELGDYSGIYEYKSVTNAIEEIFDPFDIFPKINEVFKKSASKSNSEILSMTAQTITENTDIPVVIEEFVKSDHSYVRLPNGNIYMRSSDPNNYGVRTNQYACTLEMWEEIKQIGFSSSIDYHNPAGEVLLINQSKADEPETLKTCLHELGHVVEDKFIMPEKESGDRQVLDTEVISTLYGIKSGLMMAEVDQSKAVSMIKPQVELYNWILTGTVAP